MQSKKKIYYAPNYADPDAVKRDYQHKQWRKADERVQRRVFAESGVKGLYFITKRKDQQNIKNNAKNKKVCPPGGFNLQMHKIRIFKSGKHGKKKGGYKGGNKAGAETYRRGKKRVKVQGQSAYAVNEITEKRV
jgi:hypothetical protein